MAAAVQNLGNALQTVVDRNKDILETTSVAGSIVRSANRQKSAGAKEMNRQATEQANQIAEIETQTKNNAAAADATKKRQAAISRQKSAQKSGRDGTILTGDVPQLSTVLGDSGTGTRKTLLGA